MPALEDGDVLRRTTYLSLDPYMRGRMSDAPSYAAPVNLARRHVRPHRQRGRRVAPPGLPRRRRRRRVRRLAAVRRVERQGSAEAGSEGRPGVDGDRRPRHAGRDRVRRPASTSASRSRARRSSSPRRQARSDRLSASSRRSTGAVPSASPGRPTSAATSSRSWASTPASTTRPTISSRRCGPRARTAPTSISRTSAARCSRRCCA